MTEGPLCDLAELLRELRGLERRHGTSGRDRISHRPGAHDDRANAVAEAIAAALQTTRRMAPEFVSRCLAAGQRHSQRERMF